MKLGIFDRILLAILLIVAIVFSVALFGISLNIIRLDTVTDFVSLFYTFTQNKLILAGSGLILLIISLKLLFAGRGKRGKEPQRPESTLIKQSDIGGTFIALSAIDSMVQKFCAAQDRVRDCHTTVRSVENGVNIGVRLSVLANTDIVSLTEQLQTQLKEHVETMMGVHVQEVGILVENADVAEAQPPLPPAPRVQ